MFKKYTTFFIFLIIGIVLLPLLLLYQDDFSILGWANATAVTSVLLFAIGWSLIIYNNGIFDIITYGVSSFFLGIVGKKRKKDFYEQQQEKEKVKKETYISIWISSVPFIIATLIFHFIYL